MITRAEILALGLPLDDHGALAKALSVGRVKIGTVSRAWFATWAAGNGMRAIIEDTAATVGHPLRSVALACKDVLAGAADGIDMSLPENQAMVGAWVQAGLMPQAEADKLLSFATQPDPVTSQEVGAVLEGYSDGH